MCAAFLSAPTRRSPRQLRGGAHLLTRTPKGPAAGVFDFSWDDPEGKHKRLRRMAGDAKRLLAVALFAALGICVFVPALRMARHRGALQGGQQQQPAGAVEAVEGSSLGRNSTATATAGRRSGSPEAPLSARRLLLATHTRLLWLDCDTRETTLLHEGQGIYYGHFPGAETDELGAPTTLWVISRPHNWRPKDADEYLLHLDIRTGEEIGRVKVPSKFSHDAIRVGDRVFVASTGDGRILELSFPSMRLERSHGLFTLKQHINTLSPVLLPPLPGAQGPGGASASSSSSPTKLWAMLHRKGPSQAVEVDLSGAEARLTGKTLEQVGTMSHGLVHWRGGLLVLDSRRAALLHVGTGTSGSRTVLWESDQNPRPFLKGLAVLDDVAFIGVSAPSERSQRNDPTLDSEVAAVDLDKRLLLWISPVPTHGLLNAISAPHLSEDSSYHASFSSDFRRVAEVSRLLLAQDAEEAEAEEEEEEEEDGDEDEDEEEKEGLQPLLRASDGGSSSAPRAAERSYRNVFDALERPGGSGNSMTGDEALDDAASIKEGGRVYVDESKMLGREADMERGPDIRWDKIGESFVGGRWGSGLPHMDLNKKVGGLHSSAAFLPLLHLDSSALRDTVLAEPFEAWTAAGQMRLNAWLDGRSENMEAIKPGVHSIHLIFSDGKVRLGKPVLALEFPYFRRYSEVLEPILDAVLGENKRNVIRLQLARMAPGSLINHHKDDGSWVKHAHRIHVPLATGPGVEFHMCGREKDNTTSLGECSRLIYGEGDVFEINNIRMHYLRNAWDRPRIHLVIDAVEQDVVRKELRVSQVCNYKSKRIVC